MLWRVFIYLMFLFYYTCSGQIVLAPAKEQLANEATKLKLKLNLETKGSNGSIKALKAKLSPHVRYPGHEPGALYHWPGGLVRYYVDGNSYGEGVAYLLTMAFDVIQAAGEYDCPRFERLHQEPGGGDWLHFTNPDHVRTCVHEPAINRGGETRIVLGYDCLNPREVLHTVLHGLGFRDEIMHPKRDHFVRVMWENIQPAFRSMFRLQPIEAINGLADYDPMSIMHFHDRAYSVNGQPTIMPVLPGLKIDPSDKLSRLDTMKIRRLFGRECKTLQINNILDSCGMNNNVDVTPNDAGPCGNGRGNQIAPGNVQPDSNKNGIVIPGNNVHPQHNNEDSVDNDAQTAAGSDVDGGSNDKAAIAGDDQAAIAGDDEKAIAGDDENAIAGDDQAAIAGDDQAAIAGDDEKAIAGDDENAIAGDDQAAIAGDDQAAIAGDDQTAIAGDDVQAAGDGDETLANEDNQISLHKPKAQLSKFRGLQQLSNVG